MYTVHDNGTRDPSRNKSWWYLMYILNKGFCYKHYKRIKV